MTTDAGRNELFGNAAQRHNERPGAQQSGASYGQSGVGGGASGAYGDQAPGGGASGAYGAQAPGGYGAYGDRELTAEEQEEEDITAAKSEIKFIKQQDVSSTRNALRLAMQAEETGRDTLARLGAQGERYLSLYPTRFQFADLCLGFTTRRETWTLPRARTGSQKRKLGS